ncbi:beta-lactamase family protein [Stakelama sp. CBK3Z-3]|uniref:Beta-lactamase family protein n=1 Tax=Stakelama flava TaxID=2860338 RepID=A0ABS6XHW7_9SPHN|nr:serine hydrolase domain-containing protein [Stakelama flava]MBW4329800.1 beta-lactamase family protein [Stakelama flava]
MKHLASAALLAIFAVPTIGNARQSSATDASTPASYVETELLPDGSFSTRVGGAGREGALYEAGSISKYACSIAAMALQRQGRLKLTDTLATLLPDYRGAKAGEITLEQLLQNRAGIADGAMIAVREDAKATLALKLSPTEAANRFATRYTDDPPGTAFDYVITNWILVQAILERASGSSIHDVLRDTVYVPAEMTHSTSFTDTLPGDDPVKPVGFTLPMPSYLVCAGGTAATPEDLIRLLRYPYTPGYPGADREALARVASAGSHYALGGRTRVVTVDGVAHPLSWKSGSNGAFKSRAAYDPISDTGYAIVTNEGDLELLQARTNDWAKRTLGAAPGGD